MIYKKQRQLNSTIPDNKKKGLLDSIKISRDAKIKNFRLRVNIEHPYIGDLSIRLMGPSKNNISLWKQTNKKGINLDKTFNSKDLKKYIGKKAAGEWTLQVVDAGARDIGKLVSWEMEMELNPSKLSESLIPNSKGNNFVSKHYCHENGTVRKLDALIDIAKNKSESLVVNLSSPSGKTVCIHNGMAAKSSRLKNKYTNKQLSSFKGENAKGAWTLDVNCKKGDRMAVLKQWKLNIDTNN